MCCLKWYRKKKTNSVIDVRNQETRIKLYSRAIQFKDSFEGAEHRESIYILMVCLSIKRDLPLGKEGAEPVVCGVKTDSIVKPCPEEGLVDWGVGMGVRYRTTLVVYDYRCMKFSLQFLMM